MNKKIKFLFIFLAVAAAAVFIVMRLMPKKDSGEMVSEVSPAYGRIQTIISTTGTVLPKNRLEIKPPVGGRLESILVKEGQMVKDGDILAWMSSTERAALLDAAEKQGEQELRYWQEAYKPIALLSPIDGEVIVETCQPGQTVTANDAVAVLSDKLIVRAQVDETDIGKIKLNQDAIISIDAYPDIKIKSRAEHIYYESKTVNNVTIYEVDLAPETVPLFFRSGMNANIDFIEESRQNALLLPLEAVHKGKEGDYVLVRENAFNGTAKRAVKAGISDDNNIEIISGVGPKDVIIIKSKKYALPKSDTGTNPFTPFGRRRQGGR